MVGADMPQMAKTVLWSRPGTPNPAQGHPLEDRDFDLMLPELATLACRGAPI
jgi:hypothetical protein